MRKISVSEFKSTCLARLQEVSRTGEPILVTKRGKPLALVLPPPPAKSDSRASGFWAMAGSAEELDDIVQPLPSAAWGNMG